MASIRERAEQAERERDEALVERWVDLHADHVRILPPDEAWAKCEAKGGVKLYKSVVGQWWWAELTKSDDRYRYYKVAGATEDEAIQLLELAIRALDAQEEEDEVPDQTTTGISSESDDGPEAS